MKQKSESSQNIKFQKRDYKRKTLSQEEIDKKLWQFVKESTSFESMDLSVAKRLIKKRLNIDVKEFKEIYKIGEDELPLLRIIDQQGKDLGIILTGGYYNTVKSWKDIIKEYPELIHSKMEYEG